jgi:hypothetical protein
MLATIDQRSTRVGKADAARWLPSAINQPSQLSQELPDRDRAARGQRICAIFLSDTPARGRVPTNGTGTLHGFAVSDGDTVKFGKQRVRLFGIDAPEKLQPCDGGHWYPGPLATKALVAFIAGRPVSCHEVDYDHKNNRPVAVCFAGKDDLQALMVSAGWAWAYTAFSDQYVDAERRAAARGVGVHAHHCQPPRRIHG